MTGKVFFPYPTNSVILASHPPSPPPTVPPTLKITKMKFMGKFTPI
jgi:hypothetical protein